MEKPLLKDFAKYVSLNILGMIGLSCYILVDTFFVATALGSTGLAALNFSISIYSVIHGFGLMIGSGGATRYSILNSQNEHKKANTVFTTCLKIGLITGIILVLGGILASKHLAHILGADASTLQLTQIYLTTILCCAPFFISNNILIAFVRNDSSPKLAMLAMLTGSFSNIVLDYLFMFPLNMGIFGAALATGLAPIISLAILSKHFSKRKNSFRYSKSKLTLVNTIDVLKLGLSALITEVSSAVVLIAFNLAIFNLKGNLGVAAYGIIANLALVGIAVFTGIAQGIQPLVSKAYGLQDIKLLRKIIKFSFYTALLLATVIYFGVFCNTDLIIGIFNSEQNLELAQIVKAGLRIYFSGFIFASINIVLSTYLSATENTKGAFAVSITRGCVFILPMVLLLSKVWGITGIWLSFVITELIVTILALWWQLQTRKQRRDNPREIFDRLGELSE